MRRRSLYILMSVAVGACSGGGDRTAKPATAATTPDRARPAPGMDLDGPIPLPDRSQRKAPSTPPQMLALGDDRALVSVAVPKLPRLSRV